jgi:hypothetical protein
LAKPAVIHEGDWVEHVKVIFGIGNDAYVLGTIGDVEISALNNGFPRIVDGKGIIKQYA